MARRTPFHAFLTKIASEGKSCPSGSTMVAGKCVPNEASTSRTLSTTSKTPASSRSSIPTSYLKISPTGGIVAPEKKLITSEVSSGKHDISPTGGISASSISSTPTTFQKAVSTPTIAIQKPETAVLGGISISPASGVTTSIKRTVAVHEEQPVTRTPISIGSSRTRVADYSTPNTANPNKTISEDSIKAIKEKITLEGGVSVNSQSKPRTAIYDNIDAKRNLGGSTSVSTTSGKAITTPTITPVARPFPVTEAKPVTNADEASGYLYKGVPLKQ